MSFFYYNFNSLRYSVTSDVRPALMASNSKFRLQWSSVRFFYSVEKMQTGTEI